MTERKAVENEIKQLKKHLFHYKLDNEDKEWYEAQIERLERKLNTLPKKDKLKFKYRKRPLY